MPPVHDAHRPRNLTPAEEAEVNDIDHELGCFCPECRPDYHADHDQFPAEPAQGATRAA